jgi:uncharacterized membrane protein
MMLDKRQQVVATTTLVIAVVTSGLLAGVYYSYSVSVMPALAAFDDRTFVDVMNKLNVVIVNPAFMLVFLGSVGFSALAGVCYRKSDNRPLLICIAIGLALNVASLIITSAVNVPLNSQLATAGSTATDVAGLRRQFEAPWITWNLVRALANTAATAILAWPLVRPATG